MNLFKKQPKQPQVRTKQVLVLRRDLTIRRGKEVAQGAHASLAFITRRLIRIIGGYHLVKLTAAERSWLKNSYVKICLQCDTLEDMQDIHAKAISLGVETQLITDSGRTEFKGVPTVTALALGPDLVEKIDAVTGHLTLY